MIGHREIVLTEQNIINSNGGNDNYAVGSIARGTEDVVLSNNSFTDRINAENYFRVYSNDMGIPDSVVLSEDSSETSNSITRQLVVIAIRGSVTPEDWWMDLAKEIIPCKFVCMADLQGINFIRFSSQNQKLGIYFYINL